MGPYYYPCFTTVKVILILTDSFQSYINEIDTCILWGGFNQVRPEIIQIEVPKKYCIKKRGNQKVRAQVLKFMLS